MATVDTSRCGAFSSAPTVTGIAVTSRDVTTVSAVPTEPIRLEVKTDGMARAVMVDVVEQSAIVVAMGNVEGFL